MSTKNGGILDGHHVVIDTKKKPTPTATDLTIADRKKLIADKQGGASVAHLMEKYNVSKSTVHRVWRNRKKILASGCDAGKRVAATLFRPVLEARVLEWIDELVVRSQPKKTRFQVVTTAALIRSATKIAGKLVKSPPADLTDLEKERLKGWKPAESWAKRFVTRNKLRNETEDDPMTMTNAITAAAQALDKLRDVSVVESMSWPEAKPLLSAIIAPTLVVMRSLQGVPPGLLGETQQFEQSLLNAKLPSASAKRKQPQSKKTLSSSSVFKKKCRRGEIARMASTGDR